MIIRHLADTHKAFSSANCTGRESTALLFYPGIPKLNHFFISPTVRYYGFIPCFPRIPKVRWRPVLHTLQAHPFLIGVPFPQEQSIRYFSGTLWALQPHPLDFLCSCIWDSEVSLDIRLLRATASWLWDVWRMHISWQLLALLGVLHFQQIFGTGHYIFKQLRWGRRFLRQLKCRNCH